MNSERKTFRITKEANAIVNFYMEEKGCGFTDAINALICSHKTSEDTADLFLKKFDEQYNKLLTRVRLGVTATDKNVQVLIEHVNTLAYEREHQGKPLKLMPTEYFETEYVKEGKSHVNERIARFKQINDEKKRKKSLMDKNV